MKAFLIVAGVLMTGASVYGVVDYNKKLHTREFKEMYKEEPAKDSEVTTETVVTTDVPAANTVTIPLKSETVKKEVTRKISKKAADKKKKKREFKLKEFSRAPLKG